MKVNIGKHQYRISSDVHQYILAKYTGRKDEEGRDIVESIGFYPHIEHLIESLLDKEARLSDATSLEKHLKEYQKISRDVKKIAQTMAKLMGKESEFKKKLEAD